MFLPWVTHGEIKEEREREVERKSEEVTLVVAYGRERWSLVSMRGGAWCL